MPEEQEQETPDRDDATATGMKRCPSCRAEIENDDVAHFDAHKEYEERLAALEKRGQAPDSNNPGRRLVFDLNPFPERPGDATKDHEAETDAAQ